MSLLYNLYTKQIDTRIVAWIGNFLTGRSTIFCINKYTTEKISISIGISQGSPLLLILFLFYNAPLLEDLEKIRSISVAVFVDDITILVEKKTYKKNFTVLHNLHEKICKP